ncbi:PREDICTED: cellulose synthase-like protein G1 isoform X2 [Erythranthe guttata]|uniref:cellulose synthase-like protein G1 isoform X2 n=1 Tax=Erythranthe guttata TaxID=4155 RepID=UPI00064DC543|nr:PREDICTED: cellulose synthase-like protein G1 isoform X2 [Erythranthe guttata]|eukprot:XP_012842665.1 PREDICTED: cellulose synthase-like protein G1 isoform X2 [Erythranthe guttata]
MENSVSLSDCHVKKKNLIINRFHFFIHGISLIALLHYRITTSSLTRAPHVLILISELILSSIWLLGQASYWRPVVTRTVYPERLPRDEKLPGIDVFVCTADPSKEPVLQVMNTVISALALDYPPDKLHVYLSDDGGSHVTFRAVKRAWIFSEMWVPFCRKYRVENPCPESYFSSGEEESAGFGCSEFLVDKYNIEVISDSNGDRKLPLLVYVAREKRPSRPHNFKAGAINVLLRISGMISNSPYILVLDCDFYCNDRSSARQAMCFHLDSNLSEKIAFVQFPQTFHNISDTDIYDGKLRYIWPKFEGLNGLRGPFLSGTCFYIKREALYGTRKFHDDVDLLRVKKYFGSSDEFIKSISRNYKPSYSNDKKFLDNSLQNELHLLASCSYDNDTKWGKEVGFRYFAVVEDYFTGLNLHCEGWTSVYYEPSRPCFLGASPISLGELLVQHTRWNVGLSQVALSRFSPMIYGTMRMSVFQSMCYAEIAYSPLYFLALYILALVPQLCLLQGIPLYPEISNPYLLVFLFVVLSSQARHLQDVFSTGHKIQAWSNEHRIWMMKSLTCYFYATLDVIMEKFGLKNNSFVPTNKVVDEEQAKRYRMGVYDFQAPAMFMVPLCTLYIVNVASFVVGIGKIILGGGNSNEMVVQACIPLFVAVLNFPLLEGMVSRKDKGRVSSFVSLISVLIAAVVLSFAFLV